MAHVSFSPPYTPASQVAQQLRDRGYAVLQPGGTAAWIGCELAELQVLSSDWADLPPDDFLKDGGRYRRRPGCGLSRAAFPPRARKGPLLFAAEPRVRRVHLF